MLANIIGESNESNNDENDNNEQSKKQSLTSDSENGNEEEEKEKEKDKNQHYSIKYDKRSETSQSNHQRNINLNNDNQKDESNENENSNEYESESRDSEEITTSVRKKIDAVKFPNKQESIRNSNQSKKQSINKNINDILNNQNQINNNEDPYTYYVKYVQENRKGFESLKEKNYLSGKTNYEKCYNISSQYLKDKVKQIDSLINMSVCDFYNGNFEGSVKDLDIADNIYKTINIQEDNIIPRIYAHLGLKLYSNYCMSNMAVNKTKESVGNIRKIEGIIRAEPNPQKEESYLRSVVYTLFRVNSLSNCDSLEIGDFNNNNKIIAHIMKGFQQFLQNGNYEILCTCFAEAMNKYSEIKDNNGYLFSSFYYNVTLYQMGKSTENDINNIKKNLSVFNKKVISNELINDVKEKDFDSVMREFKEKADASIEIFKILTNLEKECMQKILENKSDDDLSRSKLLDKSHIFTNEKISSPIFIKLLIKYSLNFLNEENDISDNTRILSNELSNLLNKINNEEIDISKIKLKFLDPTLTNSLKQLFDNLIYIYYKHLLRKGFNKYRNAFCKENIIQYDNQINDFFVANYNKIESGDQLKKINYTSNGIKSHYYKISKTDFQQKEKKADKTASKSYNLKKSVIKVMYGFSSQNIKKKILSKEKDNEFIKLINFPWRFISIITKERPIDLYCEDNQINNWFYGLKHHFNINNMPYKIMSTNRYILTKIKFKIVQKLKKSFQNDNLKENDNESKQIVKELSREKGVQNYSFCKLLIFYDKLIKD